MTPHTESWIRAAIPQGWSVKESWTLLAPGGYANLIVTREPLDYSIDLPRYAEVQGELLKREFPGYQQLALGPMVLECGRALVRVFEWHPPEGPVRQIQLYFVHPGHGFCATGTARAAQFDEVRETFEQVLADLRFGPPPPPPSPQYPG